jgi:hypothetical protein
MVPPVDCDAYCDTFRRPGSRNADRPVPWRSRRIADIGGACRQQAGLRPGGAPQPDIDKQGLRGRGYATRDLARDQHLKLQQIDDADLDELRLGDRGDVLQYRLVREE